MSQISAAAQQLFDALPLDGEKRGNVGLSEEKEGDRQNKLRFPHHRY